MKFLSGIRPTNLLHIGNYFGALKQFVEFQKTNDGLIMIADLHSLDTVQKPSDLRRNILRLTATYLAVGLDADKNILFQQSAIPEHAELAWIFSSLMKMSELERMTQYKEKAKVRKENVPVALFTYPTLMAADILLYDPEIIPVGDDQVQHVEFARDIAERFNRIYGDTFKLPKAHLREGAKRIMALDDPLKKMSKSAESAKNYIALLDEPDVMRKKIQTAVTDSRNTIEYSDEQPGVKNLIDIFALVVDKTPNDIVASYNGKGYGDFKRDTAEAVVSYFSPIRERILTLLSDETSLAQIINDGTSRAQAIAINKISEVRERIGLSL
ncbi:MAG: tryptophan--tRNA ligase [Patescibacteria group bacterium]